MRAASLGVLALALVTVSRAAAPQSAQAVRLPYVEADSRFVNVTDPNNPFTDSYRSGVRAGGDMKVGLVWQQNRRPTVTGARCVRATCLMHSARPVTTSWRSR